MFTGDKFTPIAMLGLLAVGSTLFGCNSRPPPSRPREVPEVAFVVVAPEPVSLTTELPGRTSAYLEAEVRPQVSGIIQSRRFEEGQDVSAGDALYQIDPEILLQRLDEIEGYSERNEAGSCYKSSL